MKMVLQFQSVKLGSDGRYSGEATYLTELLFEQTSYQTAEKSIRETVAPTGAYVNGVAMTIDGNSGKWGCIVKYSKASAPLPLAFGIDLDNQDEINAYYRDYALAKVEEMNQAKDENGEYLYDEIKEIINIFEKKDYLTLHVIYADGSEGAQDIPYPVQ